MPLTGRRRANRDGYPRALLLGAPVERRVGPLLSELAAPPHRMVRAAVGEPSSCTMDQFDQAYEAAQAKSARPR
jgi:hypothetical protein